MATISEYFGCTQPKRAGRKTNSSLLVGIEIELERVDIIKDHYPWAAIRDGSLRNNGLEFILCTWNTASNQYLNLLFDSVSAKISSRCSVHIHVDITSFTLEQCKNLILLYTIFERPLYRFAGNRWNNIFCTPVQEYIAQSINQLELADLPNVFPKYSGFHLLADNGKKGTVEFRHMTGSKDPDYIQTWINMLTMLVSFASNQNYEELVERIRTMQSDSSYRDLLQEIFKEYRHALMYSDFTQDVEHGVLIAKLISI